MRSKKRFETFSFEGVRVLLTPEDPSGEGEAGPNRRWRLGYSRHLRRPEVSSLIYLRQFCFRASFFGRRLCGTHSKVMLFLCFLLERKNEYCRMVSKFSGRSVCVPKAILSALAAPLNLTYHSTVIILGLFFWQGIKRPSFDSNAFLVFLLERKNYYCRMVSEF